jgi:hypothetical protein
MENTVYEQLIAEITDEDERKVFDVLLRADGGRVSREELVWDVYGVTIDPSKLANSVEDRKIRTIIRRLRERDYPIVSSSGEPGYTMKANPEEMDIYIAELASRKERLQEDIDHGYRSKEKARLVKECREAFGYQKAGPVAVQLSLLAAEVEA